MSPRRERTWLNIWISLALVGALAAGVQLAVAALPFAVAPCF